MADDTKIEWADDTVNPWWGCAKVSPACANCYAESLDARFHPDRHILYQGGTYTEKGGHWGATAPRKIRIDKAIADLERIARRGDREGRPRRVFIASMADVFEDRADLVEPRKDLWEALHRLSGRITPLLLTKRPDVMAAWAAEHGWPAGAWAGTTVEDQQRADERIPELLKVPAPMRFLSCEPLLGPVDLPYLWTTQRIGWVIAGGESGPGARPSHPDWFRHLRDQCHAPGVPFFFKQWGAWAPHNLHRAWDCDQDYGVKPKGFGMFDYCGRWNPGDYPNPFRQSMVRVGKKAAGAILDGREWREVPDVG